MQDKIIHFRSCFICEVNIGEYSIELIDSTHASFFIDSSNEELMKQFKEWFKFVYRSCVPQTLTIIQYDSVDKDGEPFMIVRNLIYRKNSENAMTMLNEKKEIA